MDIKKDVREASQTSVTEGQTKKGLASELYERSGGMGEGCLGLGEEGE